MRARSIAIAVDAAVLAVLFVPPAGAQPAGRSPSPASWLCRDSGGGAYSPGAIVEIGGKPMKCVVGPHWVPGDDSASDADVLDLAGENPNAAIEAGILKRLAGPALPPLECDAVLNSTVGASQLLRLAADEKRIVMFWTPTCGPCKPLLAQLAAVAERKPRNVSVLGVVQAADPDFEPPGEWRLSRVKALVAQYKVGFPTCVHSSRALSKRWQAEGVPLTLLLSSKGVEEVALGGTEGRQLIERLVPERVER